MTKQKIPHQKNQPLRAAKDLLHGFRVEADPGGRGLSVTVSGADGILSFSDQEAEVRSGRRIVRLCGEHMTLAVFENRCVAITGKIKEIVFA